MLTAFANTSAPTVGGPHGPVWIDLFNPTEDEINRVTQATGLHVPTQAEVSEIETSSRLVRRGRVLYLSMPLITIADGPRVAAAGFVLSPKRLLTVRFAPSQVFDAYIARLSDGDVNFTRLSGDDFNSARLSGDDVNSARLSGDDAPNAAGAHLLFGLLAAIVDRQADAVERIHANLDTISHRVFSLAGDKRAGRKQEDQLLRDTLAELGRIGDLISHIRETQLGAARLLPFIDVNTADWLPAALRPELVTLRDDIASVSDFDNHLADKTQFLLDATLGFINIAQNDVMKVMTIASVVGIPPVLVAGIYGMNFKSIPEYDWSFGYQYGLGLIVLTALIPLAIFRWRKWI